MNKSTKSRQILQVLDNSGAKTFRVIHYYKNKQGRIGDICNGSVQKVKTGSKVKKGAIFKAIIIRCKDRFVHPSGIWVQHKVNGAVLLDENMALVGSSSTSTLLKTIKQRWPILQKMKFAATELSESKR